MTATLYLNNPAAQEKGITQAPLPRKCNLRKGNYKRFKPQSKRSKQDRGHRFNVYNRRHEIATGIVDMPLNEGVRSPRKSSTVSDESSEALEIVALKTRSQTANWDDQKAQVNEFEKILAQEKDAFETPQKSVKLTVWKKKRKGKKKKRKMKEPKHINQLRVFLRGHGSQLFNSRSEAKEAINKFVQDLTEEHCELVKDIILGAPLAERCKDNRYYNFGSSMRPEKMTNMVSPKKAREWADAYQAFTRNPPAGKLEMLKKFLDISAESRKQVGSMASMIRSRMGNGCVGCREYRWHSMCFSWKWYRSTADQDGCGYGCWKCFGEHVEKRYQEIKDGHIDKSTYKCFNPNCKNHDYNCYVVHCGGSSWVEHYMKEKHGNKALQDFKNSLDQFKMGFFEPIIEKSIKFMESAELDYEKGLPQLDLERKTRNLYNNTNYRFTDNAKRAPFSEYWTKFRAASDQARLRGNLKALKQYKLECEECIQKKDWENMYKIMSKMTTRVTSANSYKSYCRNAMKGKTHGLDMQDLIKEYLDSFNFYYQRCQSFAHQCSICCETTSAKESTMIFTHPAEDKIKPKIRCMTCKPCLEKYVSMTSAIKKPKFICPGPNCGGELSVDHIKHHCPNAYDIFQESSLKYKLKVCRDFKFCPNASCGEGFAVYEGCNVSRLNCLICKHEFCPDCYGPPHEDIGDGSCRDYLKHQHRLKWICIRADMEGALESDEAIKKMEEEEALFIEKNTKQCPFCKVWIEKNGGCNHMTCHHCSGEFCWKCQKLYKGHRNCTDSMNVHRPYMYELFPKEAFPEYEIESECEEDSDDEKQTEEEEENEEKFDHEETAYQSFLNGFKAPATKSEG